MATAGVWPPSFRASPESSTRLSVWSSPAAVPRSWSAGWWRRSGLESLPTNPYLYALRALLVESVPLAGANEAALLSQTTWSLAFGPIAILLLLYPTGRLVSRGWMWAGVAAALAMVTIAGIGTLVLWPYRQAGAELLNLDDSLINDRVAPMFNVGLILLFGGAGRLLCFVDRSLTS